MSPSSRPDLCRLCVAAYIVVLLGSPAVNAAGPAFVQGDRVQGELDGGEVLRTVVCVDAGRSLRVVYEPASARLRVDALNGAPVAEQHIPDLRDAGDLYFSPSTSGAVLVELDAFRGPHRLRFHRHRACTPDERAAFYAAWLRDRASKASEGPDPALRFRWAGPRDSLWYGAPCRPDFASRETHCRARGGALVALSPPPRHRIVLRADQGALAVYAPIWGDFVELAQGAGVPALEAPVLSPGVHLVLLGEPDAELSVRFEAACDTSELSPDDHPAAAPSLSMPQDFGELCPGDRDFRVFDASAHRALLFELEAPPGTRLHIHDGRGRLESFAPGRITTEHAYEGPVLLEVEGDGGAWKLRGDDNAHPCDALCHRYLLETLQRPVAKFVGEHRASSESGWPTEVRHHQTPGSWDGELLVLQHGPDGRLRQIGSFSAESSVDGACPGRDIDGVEATGFGEACVIGTDSDSECCDASGESRSFRECFSLQR